MQRKLCTCICKYLLVHKGAASVSLSPATGDGVYMSECVCVCMHALVRVSLSVARLCLRSIRPVGPARRGNFNYACRCRPSGTEAVSWLRKPQRHALYLRRL